MATNETGHEGGVMDITEQERTFQGFLKAGVYLAVVVIVALIILAIFGR